MKNPLSFLRAAITRIRARLRPAGYAAGSLFHYRGYSIPVHLVNLTGGGPETFDPISRQHMAKLREFVGLRDDLNVMEIGCGIGRDAIPLTEILSKRGSYVGIDIIKDSIDWCNANIGRRHPNFHFIHYDVKDQLHNPAGQSRTAAIALPAGDKSTDLIILQSVFTHMFREDIIHYMKEFARVLKPSGRAYATCFIVDDAVLERARQTNLTPFNLRFEHSWGEGCFVNDPKHPAGAVAYTPDSFTAMIDQSGLKLVRPFLRGAWSGYYPNPEDSQDVAILAPK